MAARKLNWVSKKGFDLKINRAVSKISYIFEKNNRLERTNGNIHTSICKKEYC